jgi:hypothetical protein
VRRADVHVSTVRGNETLPEMVDYLDEKLRVVLRSSATDMMLERVVQVWYGCRVRGVAHEAQGMRESDSGIGSGFGGTGRHCKSVQVLSFC